VIIPGFRNIRVFFGDGHGNFPRMTRALIAQLHTANIPSSLPDLGVDRMNQPRDIAIGHFTRTDQTQIAAGMGEGDLVVFAYEQGALKEVSRTPTEYWLLDIRAGSFRNSGLNDLYVMGTLIWGGMYPWPRLFYGTPAAAANTDAAVRFGGRGRAARPPASASALQMQLRGECIDYRLNAPYATYAVKGDLVQHDGVYAGTADVMTSCGWKVMNITAKAE